jgi:hypothetical protein
MINKHFKMGPESEVPMKRKPKQQNYTTVSIGPDKVGQDRRDRYYKAADEAGMTFSAWAVSILDKATLIDSRASKAA